jgi:Domain of unknown function (DUF5666)
MQGEGLRLPRLWPFFTEIWLPLTASLASKNGVEENSRTTTMHRSPLTVIRKLSLAALAIVLSHAAIGQTIPSQNAPLTPSAAPKQDPAISAATNPATASQPGNADSAAFTADVPDTTPDTTMDPASLLPDPSPLPRANASLIGGTIEKLDRVRDRITVRVFGGGKMTFAFDPRTHIYLGNSDAATSDLHQGDRVSVDTQLDGSVVFARTIRIHSTAPAGESQGAVISYRGDELVLRDTLSPRPLKIHLTSETRLIHGDHAASPADIVPGTLVAVKFGTQRHGDTASEISVLAVPGGSFSFSGRITALDLSAGLLTLKSSTDSKSYEVYFDPSVSGVDNNLREGDDIMVVTRFDGDRYVARSLTVNARNRQ